MKTIGLCMIVKNESAVMLQCLQSVRPLVDFVLVQDTGSTDGTQQIVRDYLQQESLPGEVYDEPWIDFATNRSMALARLREHREIDFALIIDADDVLTYAPGFDARTFKQNLSADLYNVWIDLPPIRYHRPQLCSNHLPFRYRGVLHEFLEGPPEYTSDYAHGISMLCGRGGARSKVADKYRHDAEVLEKALRTESDSMLVSRYTFYLAQSYRDAGEDAKALPLYLKRASQDHWIEERYISMYEAAHIKARQGCATHEVIGLYMAAFELVPARAEALHAAMRLCRNHKLYHQGYLIGKYAVTVPLPEHGLFLESWVYVYGVFDEFSVLSYWTGHYAECLDYAQRILNDRRMPGNEMDRVRQNVAFAMQALQSQKGAG